MKKKALQELKNKTIAELKKLALTNSSSLNKTRTELLTGKHKNVRVVKNIRQDLARIYTILKEKDLQTVATEKGATKS
ncbi:MAG: 50S ribosomal protein L29 [bacterium]|nr:50S ribosomal protein L29 [bacterium]